MCTNCVHSCFKLLETFIFWKLQSIETSITLRVGISLFIRYPPQCKSFYLAAIALEVLKTIYRQTRTSCAIMQHVSKHISVESMHDFPEPFHYSISLRIPFVDSACPPVIHVDIFLTTEKAIDFMRLKNHEVLKWNDFEKFLFESLNCFSTFFDTVVFDPKIKLLLQFGNIVLFVFFIYKNIFSTRNHFARYRSFYYRILVLPCEV